MIRTSPIPRCARKERAGIGSFHQPPSLSCGPAARGFPLSALEWTALIQSVLTRSTLFRSTLILSAFVLCALVLVFPGSKALAAENTLAAKNTAGQETGHKLVDATDATAHKTSMPADGQNKVTRPLRIICWEGGPYNDHVLLMQGLIRELVRLGLARNAPLPLTVENNIDVYWNWLSENAGPEEALKGEEHDSERALLSFPKDGFYSADWNSQRREEMKKAIDERIRTVGDVDMIVVLDTNSLFDALSLDLDIPVLAASITSLDALLASMQKGTVKDGYKDNYLVLNETDRIPRLVALAHKIFAFKKLGAVFDSAPSGRAMAGIAQLEQAARDHGFELVTCSTKLWGESAKNVRTNLSRCHDELVSKGMDALYVTPTPLEENAWDMTAVFEPLRRMQIPTISHRGHNEVMMGALMGPGSKEQKTHGARMADIMVRLAQGDDPKDIDTVCAAQSVLALNMITAIHIGWDPPLSVLSLVEEYLNSDGIWIESDDVQ